MESKQEFALIKRIRSGDRAAYAEIIRAHQAKILQLCLSLLGDPAEAEDAASETFLSAYKSLGRFRADASLSTWLYRIASNRCLDRLRRISRRRTESWEHLIEDEGERLAGAFAAGPAASAEAADLLRRLLARLPEPQRLALLLREQQGLSYEEIAEAMDCTLDSVKARLRRARRLLDENLRHFLDPPGV